MEVPVAIGGDNLSSPVGIGLTNLPNIGGANGPPGPPGFGITAVSFSEKTRQEKLNGLLLLHAIISGAGTGGGPGGPLAPPIFGRSVNPIPTGEGRSSPPIATGTPNVFHLPALLSVDLFGQGYNIFDQGIDETEY